MFWKDQSFCFKIIGKIASTKQNDNKKIHKKQNKPKELNTLPISHICFSFFQGHLYLKYLSLQNSPCLLSLPLSKTMSKVISYRPIIWDWRLTIMTRCTEFPPHATKLGATPVNCLVEDTGQQLAEFSLKLSWVSFPNPWYSCLAALMVIVLIHA